MPSRHKPDCPFKDRSYSMSKEGQTLEVSDIGMASLTHVGFGEEGDTFKWKFCPMCGVDYSDNTSVSLTQQGSSLSDGESKGCKDRQLNSEGLGSLGRIPGTLGPSWFKKVTASPFRWITGKGDKRK